MKRDSYMRKVVFRPYVRRADLPYFVLYLIDRRGGLGPAKVSYRFEQWLAGECTLVAEGDNFSPGVGMSVDGDEAVESLMGFLTIREHDTDDECFARLIATDAHREFSVHHAESVSGEVSARFTCYYCGSTRACECHARWRMQHKRGA